MVEASGWPELTRSLDAHLGARRPGRSAQDGTLAWTYSGGATRAAAVLFYPDENQDRLSMLVEVTTPVGTVADSQRAHALRILREHSGWPGATGVLEPDGQVVLTFALPYTSGLPEPGRYLAEAVRRQHVLAAALARMLDGVQDGLATPDDVGPTGALDIFAGEETQSAFRRAMTETGLRFAGADAGAVVFADPEHPGISVGTGTCSTDSMFGEGIAFLATTGVGLPRRTPKETLDDTVNSVNYLLRHAARDLALPVAHTCGAMLEESGDGQHLVLTLGGFLPGAALQDYTAQNSTGQERGNALARYASLATVQARLVLEAMT